MIHRWLLRQRRDTRSTIRRPETRRGDVETAGGPMNVEAPVVLDEAHLEELLRSLITAGLQLDLEEAMREDDA